MRTVEKTALFSNKKSWTLFISSMMFIFLINIGAEYRSFHQFKQNKYYEAEASIINQYEKINKHGRKYHVLRLKNSELDFYTSSFEDIKPLRGRDVALTLVTSNVTFIDFIGIFYAPSFRISLQPKTSSIRYELADFIGNQHKESITKSLFSALFIATPPSKELREKISNFGLSHLIALSGYHLGFLGAMLFFILNPVYTFFQKRYFAHRNRFFDLSVVSALILFAYLLLADVPVSLLRAYVMMVLTLLFAYRWIEILSFSTLLITVLLIIGFAPSFLFSVGFWFSVSGVFYIYLFLHHFREVKPYWIFIFLNIFIFIAMLPIVHFIFEKFTFYQLLSPVLTMLFAVFYPVEILLHTVGYGFLLDEYVLRFLSSDIQHYRIVSPLWFLILYVLFSLAAALHKKAFFVFLILSLSFFGYSISTLSIGLV